ncbi:MAG TPA: amidohydrolase [Steroidobacteraceae bacterium]|jgi:predicted amidohydrolase YtcJ|nr:amidohydrolase [Steroidobacteraceae bacterium]
MTKHVNAALRLSTGLLLGAATLAGCGQQATDPIDQKKSAVADLALTGGAIYTMNGERAWAEAVAIDDGRIVYVGTDAGAKDFIGPQTQVIALGGRMVIPGMQDAHIHPISGGMEANACDLNALNKVEDYVAKIKECAEAHPDDPWITGGGWSMAAFGPGAIASKKLIDAVVPDRPVIVASRDGHSSWANSKAIEIAGITNETPDPPDGRIDRDPKTGEAIGSFQEGGDALIRAKQPPPTDAQRDAGLRYAIKMLNGFGITGIQDASVNEEDLKSYRRVDDAGDLSLHVVGSVWWERDKGLEQIDNIKRLRSEYTKGRLDVGAVKIMQDGVMESYTAVVLEPYKLPGKKGVQGIPMVEPELLKKAVTRLDKDGFQVHFHAIGDLAVRQALDAIEAARTTNGDLGHRHHIAHLQLIHPDDQPRFRKLGVTANFQPLWAYADEYITELTLPFISRQTASYLYPIGTMAKSGAVLAFGSDWSVSSCNPFEEMETAITRMGALGETKTPWMPDERITLPQALAAFTMGSAYVNRDEKDTGSLEVGKLANLAVLDRNLFDIPPTEISDTQVLLTLFEGKPVHGDPKAL